MEDANNFQLWTDPLLLTDVSWQQNSSNCTEPAMPSCSKNPPMSNSDSSPITHSDDPWQNQSSNEISTPIREFDGRSMLGFSLTSPDLVICTGSPDIPSQAYGDSPEFLEKHRCSIELSLENGIDGSDNKVKHKKHKTPTVKFSTVCQTFDKELSPDSSFELLPLPETADYLQKEHEHLPVISINAGCLNEAVELGGLIYSNDNCYVGGDVIRTDSMVGDGVGNSLYNTARFGDFSYMFPTLESGFYTVDLHFAEIVFTRGPAGVRVFNVYIQEEKVVSSLDIYGQVGANKPLVISNIRTFVDSCGGLLIRFEGLMRNPIVCGITVRKDSPASFKEAESAEVMGMAKLGGHESPRDISDCELEVKYKKLQSDYECQNKELAEMRRALEGLKMENQVKSKECQEACKSLQELQNELMRKSMHVGSLAFAIEGQVKEKSRWFSSLRDMTRKLKIMKMEHIKLLEEVSLYKNCIMDINETGTAILSRINQQADLHEDLKIKFIKGAKERKELYNKVLELKGNIRVFCRCRPLNYEEIAAGASMAIDFESAKDGELTVVSNGAPKKTFKFDAVFGPQAEQADVFQDTAPFATSVLDGYNVCIFAYGQTGTGKTFTMEGTKEARGVNFRTLEELFRIIKERQKLYRYEISVSALEVYNEQIRDLLVTGSQQGMVAKRLEIRQVGEGMHHVPGLVEAHVHNMNEVWEVLQTGSNARAVGSTNANEHSSRSHCIHCVMVKGENLLNGECTKSKLWLVDLAGSERVAKTEVHGERLKETQNINRSLSALGDVISALSTKSPHIPFRNSKLTHLLQDSLGGDSKTLMFVQVSPHENDLGETLCSLNFASRVRGIELGPAKKQMDNSDLLRWKQMVEKSKQDMKIKDLQIRKIEETIHGLDLKVKDKDLKNKNLQDKVKELESQLLIERKLARQHVDTKIAEQQQQQQQMKQQNEEVNNSAMRPPLATRLLGANNNLNEVTSGTLMKEQVNLTRPLMENSLKPAMPLSVADGCIKHIDLATEKENNPEMAEQLRLPKRTGRASICPTARRMSISSAPRRNSLIPLPSTPGLAQLAPPFLPLPPQPGIKEEVDEFIPEQTVCDSPKEMKSGGKKLSSILRRSLHKKVQLKSPMQQHLRRGVNVGMERVRVSIGSRGRIASRVLVGNGRRGGTKEIQQKQNQKEKERGWNIGTVGRTAI
ncbi:kinesin-like protein KIN-14Q [Durio zibethinus]|uniref:Kinesin-like protein KIN-14Q n=1 Tax=Durio zibethinus TaxID=66656 RepID=A0A6P5WPV0_DURZI|nr:kinesin-like protein KIN-14Q [Durio zibethinus]